MVYAALGLGLPTCGVVYFGTCVLVPHNYYPRSKAEMDRKHVFRLYMHALLSFHFFLAVESQRSVYPYSGCMAADQNHRVKA